MSYITKPYADRLRAAIVKSDAQTVVEQAVFVLKQAFEAEIKLVEKIQTMPQFRAWIEGERFDQVAIRGRKS